MTDRKRALLERVLANSNGSFREVRRRVEAAERERRQQGGGPARDR